MDSEQLLESFHCRFKAFGLQEPKRTAEELLAHVFHCQVGELLLGETSCPLSAGQAIAMIRELEELATRIESGESPQQVLGCVDLKKSV